VNVENTALHSRNYDGEAVNLHTISDGGQDLFVHGVGWKVVALTSAVDTNTANETCDNIVALRTFRLLMGEKRKWKPVRSRRSWERVGCRERRALRSDHSPKRGREGEEQPRQQ